MSFYLPCIRRATPKNNTVRNMVFKSKKSKLVLSVWKTYENVSNIKKTSFLSTKESSNVGLPRETWIYLHIKDFERKNCIGLSGKVCWIVPGFSLSPFAENQVLGRLNCSNKSLEVEHILLLSLPLNKQAVGVKERHWWICL